MKKPTIRSLLITCAFAVHLGSVRPGLAQEAGEPVTLDQALAQFASHSPALTLARTRLRSALGAARQTRALPNPRLSATHESLGDDSESYLYLSQPVGFLWERASRDAGAGAFSARARATFLADSAQLALELKRAFVEAWQLGEALAAYRQAEDVLASLVASAEFRFSEGDLAGYDLRRLRLELRQLARKTASAALDLEEAEWRLGAFLGSPWDPRRVSAADPGAMESPVPVLTDLVPQAFANRPEVRAAQALVAGLESEGELARKAVFSATSVLAGLKRQADGPGGLFLGVEIPLPLADRRTAAVDQARAEVRAAETELELLRQAVAQQVSLAFSRLETARRQERLQGPEGAEEALEIIAIARLSFEQGEMGALELVDATKAFLEARVSGGELRKDLLTAYFELDRAVGGLSNENPTEARER
jgi:outer membrane protein, heavy metal efflux system